MAVDDSKYENDESIGLFGFETSDVPELLREGCGWGKFQRDYIVVAPRCGPDPGVEFELVSRWGAFDDAPPPKMPQNSRGAVISPSSLR